MLSIGLSLTNNNRPGTPAAGITATTPPAQAELVVGALLSTLPASNVSTANYAVEGGTIASATYQTQENGTGAWTNRATSYAVQDLQAVRVLVTDSEGGTRAWTIDSQVTYGVDPTVALSVSSATVANGTGAGSTLATITLGNTSEGATLSGPDAALFEIVGNALRNVSTLSTAGTYSVTVNISNSRPASANATFSLTVQAAAGPFDGTYHIGANTLAGQGGVPTTLANGTYGPFTVSSGTIAPTSSPTATGTYTYGTGADEITILVEADVISVTGRTQLLAAMAVANMANVDGKTIKYQRHVSDYGNVAVSGAFNKTAIPNGVTIQPAPGPDPVPEFARFVVTGNTGANVSGNLTIDGIAVAQTQVQDNHFFPEPQEIDTAASRTHGILLEDNTDNIIIENCTVTGDYTPSASGGLLIQETTAIKVRGTASNITIRDNNLVNICTGMDIQGDGFTVSGNSIDGFYNDAMRTRSLVNSDVRDNRIMRAIGFGAILHQDLFQPVAGNPGLSNVRYFGNIGGPGDFQANTIAQPSTVIANGVDEAGDQRTEEIAIASNTTLSRASHNGAVMVLQKTDGITVTLWSDPQLGDNIWFRQLDPHLYTGVVQAGGSIVHGGGLLPRNLDNTRNNGSFMVYFDGTEWQTKYGIRAGLMYLTAGTVTLPDRANGRVYLCDATDGDINITLPPHASGAFGIGFSRLDSTSNTVTISKQTGDTWADVDDTSPTTVPVTQSYAPCFRDNSTNDGWKMQRQRWGELQGIFSNPYNSEDVEIFGNILMVNSSHNLRLEGPIPGQKVYNNTILQPASSNPLGWFQIANDSNAMRFTDAERSYVVDNLTMGVIDYTDRPATVPTDIPNAGNIALGVTDRSNLTTLRNHVVGTNMYPTTIADLLAAAQPTASGPLDGTWIGAVGYYDHVNNRVNPSAPSKTLPPNYDPGTAAPSVTATDALVGRTLTITVDTLTGSPTPTTALTALTLDGVDVSGDATGALTGPGPWSYDVPDSASVQTVAWTVTATNSEGSDTSSDTEVVAANLSAGPTYADAIGGYETSGPMFSNQPATSTFLGAEWIGNASMNFDSDGPNVPQGIIDALEAAGTKVHVMDLHQISGGTVGTVILRHFRDGAVCEVVLTLDGDTVSAVGAITPLYFGAVDVSDQYGQTAGSAAVLRIYNVVVDAASTPRHITGFTNNTSWQARTRMHYTFDGALFDLSTQAALEAQIGALVATGIT